MLIRLTDFLLISKRLLEVGIDAEAELFKRALRSVPGSGEVWARYIRFLVCSEQYFCLGMALITFALWSQERASESMAAGDLESVASGFQHTFPRSEPGNSQMITHCRRLQSGSWHGPFPKRHGANCDCDACVCELREETAGTRRFRRELVCFNDRRRRRRNTDYSPE